MNNEQFRRLLASSPQSHDVQGNGQDAAATENRRTALGSKQRSIMPMTPRTVRGSAGINFARQVAENNATGRPNSRSKFRSHAPRGSQLADGYNDRTKERNDEDKDDTAKQIKALEELFKKGEMEEAEFSRLRDEITGGDVNKTHLVKGLDWKLLKRLRNGEDVHTQSKEEVLEQEPEIDVDDAFDHLEASEVKAVQRDRTEKKGQKADPLRQAATKKTRDEILAELKASRRRAQEVTAEVSSLNSRFKKIGAPESTSRLELDARGREVLIITDANGNEKRKIRKARDDVTNDDKFQEPAMNEEVLGAEVNVPVQAAPAEESDDDIYADVGDDYDPLGGMDDDDDSGSNEEPAANVKPAPAVKQDAPEEKQHSTTRNYFQDDPRSISVLGNMSNPLTDPTILAALARKDETRQDEAENAEALTEEGARLKRKAEMLAGYDRDLDDMDMGFGSSRHDDAADMDGSRVRLSEWKGGNEDDDDAEGYHQKKQRKRGPKKRKGDKNNINDVLKVIERQKR